MKSICRSKISEKNFTFISSGSFTKYDPMLCLLWYVQNDGFNCQRGIRMHEKLKAISKLLALVLAMADKAYSSTLSLQPPATAKATWFGQDSYTP